MAYLDYPDSNLPPPILKLDISKIRLDGGTQSRVSIRTNIVERYAQLMIGGATFSPVRLWYDGEDYWVADGFHRLLAAKKAGLVTIASEIFSGTLDDARWDSLSANATHGVQRTQEDVQLIVSRAVTHQRATGMSVNQLSKHLGIPEPTLRRWMKKLSSSVGEDRMIVRRVNGKEQRHRMNTKRSGRVSLTRPIRDNHRLFQELECLKRLAAKRDTVAILCILEKWFLGVAGQTEIVEAIDRVVARGPSIQKQATAS